EFLMDDRDFIVEWDLIRDWNNLPQFFMDYTPPAGQEGIYSPLKTLFHAANYHLFGFNPFGYHVVSLIIHCLGIFFVYRIAELLTENSPAAFLAGLFFAVHPVQVEAITYMTASIDMIGIVFLFAAFYLYIKRWYKRFFLFSILAVFTHELSISLPVLFLWYDLCLRREDGIRKIILRVLPLIVLVGVYAWIKASVLGGLTRGSYVADSFYLTMLITIKAWAKYIVLLFAPFTLTHNHIISKGISSFDQTDFDPAAVTSQSLVDPQVLLSLLLIGAFVVLSYKRFYSKPLISFCIGWFFISLLPVSNIIPSGVYFGERYLYPGMLGFCVLAGIYGYQLSTQKPFKIFGILLVTAAVIAFSIRTWERNKDWRNEIVFYQSAVKANPQSALMRNDLGLVYTRFGKLPQAEESFQQALTIRQDPVTYFSLSEVYTQLQYYDKAIKALETAISLNPQYAEAHYNLAGLYAYSKNKEKALYHFDRSQELFRQQDPMIELRQMENSFKTYFGL
ncbi:MAG: tetratricopeptide repeat protein, partial [Candidatus Omnitrophica bacterium]|nr:tetratricopeptide repeat protein [Candidatus Omnitrophota bacterium]